MTKMFCFWKKFDGTREKNRYNIEIINIKAPIEKRQIPVEFPRVICYSIGNE